MSTYREYSFGCVESKKDLRDYKLNKKVCCAVVLPDKFEVEHSEIKNQRNVSSCVAHSTAEVLEAWRGNAEKYSTAWIYGYRPVGYYQGQGMMTREALKTVTKLGYLLYDDLKGNVELPEAKELVNKNLDDYKKKASERVAISYARLFSVHDIKEAIYTSGHPVVVCINVDSLELDENNIAIIPEKTNGGHAVVCYGWNETGLLIQNSWGTGYGNKGCFILPYEYEVKEAWLLTVNEPELVIKPNAYDLKEFLQTAIKVIAKCLKGLFKK